MSLRIAIHGKSFSADNRPLMEKLWQVLCEKPCEIVLSAYFKNHLKEHGFAVDNLASYEEKSGTPDHVQMAWSIGGDGTLLETLTHIGAKELPILGINTGRLGFLATLSPQDVGAAVDQLIAGNYRIEDRTLVSVHSEIDLFDGKQFGLNEVGIMKTDTSSMIVIKAYVDGNYLNTYWADGLIVATPTGSTGYNLSCNGPILFPDSSSLVITPVAPHNLNVRSIVVPDNNIISFEVEGRADQFICALDARREIVPKTVQLAIRKEQFGVNLVRLNENTFLSTLRTKLTWGLDKRN